MNNSIIKLFNNKKGERGQTLVLALIILFFGTLTVVSTLSYVSTGLKTSHAVYDVKANELYAADAGTTDAEWNIEKGDLENTYSAFDFVNSYSYVLNETINDSSVNVTIQNIWIPHDSTGPLPIPDQINAGRLISGVSGNPPKMIITSNVTPPANPGSSGTVNVKIQYYPAGGGEDLRITSLGIWLPNGFQYNPSSTSTIDSYAIGGKPDITLFNGGQSIIWDFNSYPFKGNSSNHQAAFPRNADGDPMDTNVASPLVSNIYFPFTATSSKLSLPVAWINTNLDLTQGGSSNIKYTWDGNIQVYHIQSTARSSHSINGTGTQIDAYLTKSQTRNVENTMGGDYYATGASLLKGNTSDHARYTWVSPVPVVQVDSSDIPQDANISAAYLYWSSWKNQNGVDNHLLNDTGSNFNNWNRSGSNPFTNTSWNTYSDTYGQYIRGHYGGGGDTARYLTLKNALDLSSYQPGSISISWNQWVAALGAIFSDACDNVNNWNAGNVWSSSAGKFGGNTLGKNNPTRDISLKNALDLSAYGASGTVKVSWDQSISVPSQTTLFLDSCSNGNLNSNWIGGNDWSYNNSGQNYLGYHNPSHDESGRYLTLKNELGLGAYGSGLINVSMDAPILASANQTSVPPLNPDACTNFNNWNNGAAWSLNSGSFKANGTGRSVSDRDLVLKNNILNLSSYGTTGIVNISLDAPSLSSAVQTAIAPLNPDTCDNFNNWNAGGSWTLNSGNFKGHYVNNSNRDLIVKNNLLNLSSLGTSGNINITFTVSQSNASSSDGLDFAYSLDGGSNWTTSQIFRGNNTPVTNININGVALPNNFLIKYSLVGFSYSGRNCYVDNIQVKASPVYSNSDGLDFAYSLDGGAHWTTNQVFRGTGTPIISWNIPDVVLANNFLIKFSLIGFNSTWQNCYIDNIQVKVTTNYDSNDGLDFAYSLDGGATWTSNQVFRGTGTPVVSWNFPYDSLHSRLLVRYYLVGFSRSWQSCSIDDISIKVTPSYTSADGLDFSYSLDNGTTWTTKRVFRGPDIPPTSFSYNMFYDSTKNKLLFKYSLVGFNLAGQYCYLDNIAVSNTYSDTDGLYFSFSNDGVNWTTPQTLAFSGDIGNAPKNFNYTMPASYLKNNFKVRFYLTGFDGTGKYCNIDDIKISFMHPNESIQFSINGHQVSYDSNGNPRTGGNLNSGRTQVVQNFSINEGSSPTPYGFSYSCYKDVTALVRQYTDKAADPASNYPGYGTYSVNGVDCDIFDSSGYHSEFTYAGWSIILIYSSPETKGHQLYLFDNFVYSKQDKTNGVNVDFDNDGQPGGTISGFIVPDSISGEVNAGKITCFVGEGDEAYSGDFLALNSPSNYWSHPKDIPDYYKLWDGTNSATPSDDTNNTNPQPNNKQSPDNIWNSKSLNLNADGVDIDTLGIDPPAGQYITWSSNMLKPGDTSAHIDMFTKTDGWNMVYMILSFRSMVTSGGALNYLIH